MERLQLCLATTQTLGGAALSYLLVPLEPKLTQHEVNRNLSVEFTGCWIGLPSSPKAARHNLPLNEHCFGSLPLWQQTTIFNSTYTQVMNGKEKSLSKSSPRK